LASALPLLGNSWYSRNYHAPNSLRSQRNNPGRELRLTGCNRGAGAAAFPTGLPQPPQNLAAGSFSKPQAEQGDGSGAPHWAQKRLVAAFSAVQLGQRIRCSSARETIRFKHNSEVLAGEADARRTRRDRLSARSEAVTPNCEWAVRHGWIAGFLPSRPGHP